MRSDSSNSRDLTIRIKSTKSVNLALHDLGGNGEPLLLIHATGFHAMVWQPLVSSLHGFHCWAPDMRGHGDSTSPENQDFVWSGFADDVLAVVDYLGLSEIPAIGHSKGGAALLLAEQRRPGTFRALYLYEPVVFPPSVAALISTTGNGNDNPMAKAALRRREVFESRQAAFDNFSGKPPLNTLSADALHAYVNHGFSDESDGTVKLKCHPSDEAEVYRTGWTHDAFDHLGEVMCPVFIAKGGLGPPGPGSFAQQLVDALPDGHLITFDNLGHFGPLEQPAQIASSICDVLGQR